MTSIIDKNSTAEQIKAAIKKVQPKRGFNAMKYCGKIKLQDSPVAIQKKMRNEWI